MASRRRKHRQPAALRKYWAAHRRSRSSPPRHRRTRRRRYRRNYASAGMIANAPRRRRSYKRRHPRRHYRRNPQGLQLMGFSLPPLDAIVFTGAGIIVPPIVTNLVMQYLPANWKNNKFAYYGVKAASVLVPSMLVRQFVSRRAGNLMLLGGVASFTIDLVREFAPGLLPGGSVGWQPFLGYYEQTPYRRTLGKYYGGNRTASLPPMISNTPERLMPTARF